jgi:hypothetical protein
MAAAGKVFLRGEAKLMHLTIAVITSLHVLTQGYVLMKNKKLVLLVQSPTTEFLPFFEGS